MKVLHVLDTSIPDTAGYTTRGYYLVEHQRKLGVEPVVLTSERFKGEYGSGCQDHNGIKYYRTKKSTNWLRRIPFIAVKDEIKALHQRLGEVIKQEKVDIVHAHSPSLIGAASQQVCKEKGIPFIYEIRAFWEDAAVDRGAFSEKSLQYKLRRSHETKVVASADRVIVICDGLKQDLLERGVSGDKIYVVRNGVDCEQFMPLPVEEELKSKLLLDRQKVIGFIVSFFNFEGLQDLILAMKHIKEESSNIKLLLVGSGQIHEQLEELVVQHSLKDKVIFTGRVPHDQVSHYYSIIDVLVYPRLRKRITELVTPLKPLEAMAMAKPVIVSDVGGLKELINCAGTAKIFEAGNVMQLAKTCMQLCQDDELRSSIGEKARENVMESWGWKKRAEESLNVYRSLLNVT